MVKVLSLGGSIVAPENPDVDFLKRFAALVREFLAEDESNRIILVVGGGAPARVYQKAYRDCIATPDADAQDWIGIMATRLNAQLLKALFPDYCTQEVVTDPSKVTVFAGRVLVAAGWKPGFSTDYDAVLLAERFNADTVVNLSNIRQVYTADPKTDPNAKPLDRISWADFRAIVGDEWVPGKNAPFDPVATKHAAKIGLTVVVANGRDIGNLRAILSGGEFVGTLIR